MSMNVCKIFLEVMKQIENQILNVNFSKVNELYFNVSIFS